MDVGSKLITNDHMWMHVKKKTLLQQSSTLKQDFSRAGSAVFWLELLKTPLAEIHTTATSNEMTDVIFCSPFRGNHVTAETPLQHAFRVTSSSPCAHETPPAPPPHLGIGNSWLLNRHLPLTPPRKKTTTVTTRAVCRNKSTGVKL